MRRHAVLLGLTFLGLAGLAAFAVWAFVVVSRMGGGWRSIAPVWPFVAAGLITVGLVAGGFMWLAFYSANHGYDDRPDTEHR